MQKEQFSSVAIKAIVIAVVCNLLAGAQNCWSILGKGMIANYGWTAAQASAPYTVLTICAASFASVAGMIGDRKGPKYGIMLAGLLMGGGLIISGFTTSPIVMILSAGVMIGCGSTALTANTSPGAVKNSPASRAGLVSGICTAGMALGSLYMSPLVNFLVNNFSVRTAFVTVGLIALIGMIVIGSQMPTPPHLATTVLTPEQEAERAARDAKTLYKSKLTPGQAVKTSPFWMMFIVYLCCQLLGNLVVSQAASIASVQANWEGGYILIMALALANGSGRLLSGLFADKFGTFGTYQLVLAILGVVIALFSFFRSPGLLILGVIVIGVCYGASVPLSVDAARELFGEKYLSTMTGLIWLAFGISGIFGSSIAGWAFDRTGSYTGSYIMAVCFCIVGLIFATMMRKKVLAAEE